MLKNKMDFKGKTAVVTGSTRGIGKAIADLLVELGGEVIYTGTAKGSKVNGKYLQLDLLDKSSTHDFVEKIKQISRIDILVNNAGINKIEPIDELNLKNFERIIKVNLTGSAILLKTVSELMIKSRTKGRILNISSIFGLISKEQRSSYSASKSGLIGLTRAAALDLAAHGILVNVLCPGFTRTDLTASILSKEEIEKMESDVPLRRFASVEEMAWAAVFLCSDLNTYMTGQEIVIDGGVTIK